MTNSKSPRLQIKMFESLAESEREELARMSRIVTFVTGEILASGGLELVRPEHSDEVVRTPSAFAAETSSLRVDAS